MSTFCPLDDAVQLAEYLALLQRRDCLCWYRWRLSDVHFDCFSPVGSDLLEVLKDVTAFVDFLAVRCYWQPIV